MAALRVCAVLMGLTAAVGDEPFPHNGSDWQWVPVSGSKCIDGKETGVHVRFSQSSKAGLGIYFSGGGACFNRITCSTMCDKNPHPGSPGNAGIFNASDSRNPIADLNWIAVPYCTGDVHLGAIEHKFAGSERHFSGRANLELILKRAVATFSNVNTLFVTGESAGGFGAMAGYDFVRQHWPGDDVHGILVDDSGPILDDKAIPVCLQEMWRKAWNINATLPQGCPCIGDQGNIGSAWSFVKSRWPQDSLSLVSSVNDAVISSFFSFGELDCHNEVPIGYTKLQAGLQRLSDSGVPVYMIPGGSHTHTGHSEFFTRIVNSTSLVDWVAQLADPNRPDPGTITPTAEDTEKEEGVQPVVV